MNFLIFPVVVGPKMDKTKIETVMGYIRENKLAKAISACEVSLSSLQFVLKEGLEINNEVRICWLNALLKLPFPFRKLVSDKEFEFLKNMLIKDLRFIHMHPFHKLPFKNLALFISNILNNETSDKITSFLRFGTFEGDKPDNASKCIKCDELVLLGSKFNHNEYFAILKQISKVFPRFTQYIELPNNSDEESIIIQRYMIKILANIATAENAQETLNFLLTKMNFKDHKFAWTLAKAFYKVSKLCKIEGIVEQLKLLLGNSILGREQLWINILTIFSFYVLSGFEIKDRLAFTLLALNHVRECEPRSANLRETALFFIWSFVRKGFSITEKEITKIICIALFDIEYKCRRAARSVLQEYLGRTANSRTNSIEVNLLNKKLVDIKLQEGNNISGDSGACNFNKQIDLVLSANPRRIINSSGIFTKMNFKERHGPYIFKYLTSSDFEQRVVAAAAYACIPDTDTAAIYKHSEKSSVSINAIHLSIYMRKTILGHCVKIYDSPFRLKDYYRSRQFKHLAGTYLLIYEDVNIDYLKENILFLISINFEAVELVTRVLYILKDDSEFMKKLLCLITRNKLGLALNALNTQHYPTVFKTFISNLDSGIRIPETFVALKVFAQNKWARHSSLKYEDFDLEETVKELINRSLPFLDDYSLDSQGDSGFEIRKNAFMFLWAIKEFKALEKYIVRFLADKSKRMRDEVLRLLIKMLFPSTSALTAFGINNEPDTPQDLVVKVGQSMLREPSSELCLTSQSGFSSTFNQKLCRCFSFIRSNFERSQLSTEELHFTALYDAFADDEQFGLGIINTIVASDRRLSTFLCGMIKDNLIYFIKLAVNLAYHGSPFLLAALKFIIKFLSHEFNIYFDKSEVIGPVKSAIGKLDPSKLDSPECAAYNIMCSLINYQQ